MTTWQVGGEAEASAAPTSEHTKPVGTGPFTIAVLPARCLGSEAHKVANSPCVNGRSPEPMRPVDVIPDEAVGEAMGVSGGALVAGAEVEVLRSGVGMSA